MKNDQPDVDDRGNFAKSFDKASQVFSACLMMVLPAIGGYFLDKKLSTSLVFTFIGFFFGLFAGTYHLWKLIRIQPHSDPENSRRAFENRLTSHQTSMNRNSWKRGSGDQGIDGQPDSNESDPEGGKAELSDDPPVS